MDNNSAFKPAGLCFAIAGATTPPTAVQIGGPVGVEISIQVGNSGSVWAFLGWGQTAAIAATNATVPTTTGQQCLMLPPSPFPMVFTMPAGQFYTVATVSSTATVYIQAGQGKM